MALLVPAPGRPSPFLSRRKRGAFRLPVPGCTPGELLSFSEEEPIRRIEYTATQIQAAKDGENGSAVWIDEGRGIVVSSDFVGFQVFNLEDFSLLFEFGRTQNPDFVCYTNQYRPDLGVWISSQSNALSPVPGFRFDADLLQMSTFAISANVSRAGIPALDRSSVFFTRLLRGLEIWHIESGSRSIVDETVSTYAMNFYYHPEWKMLFASQSFAPIRSAYRWIQPSPNGHRGFSRWDGLLLPGQSTTPLVSAPIIDERRKWVWFHNFHTDSVWNLTALDADTWTIQEVIENPFVINRSMMGLGISYDSSYRGAVWVDDWIIFGDSDTGVTPNPHYKNILRAYNRKTKEQRHWRTNQLTSAQDHGASIYGLAAQKLLDKNLLRVWARMGDGATADQKIRFAVFDLPCKYCR